MKNANAKRDAILRCNRSKNRKVARVRRLIARGVTYPPEGGTDLLLRYGQTRVV